MLISESCLRLFQSALTQGQSAIAIHLLSITKDFDLLAHLSGSEKANALSLVVDIGSVRDVKYLLDNGLAEVNGTDSQGNTPLMVAAREGQEECLNVLLEKGLRSGILINATAIHLYTTQY